MDCPIKIGKEISFMLYNNDDIDNMIEKRKQELSEELLKKHGSGLGPIDKSIIDRCISIVYENFKGKENPILLDLKKTLNEQPEEEAHNLALCLEIYSEGSLDIFAHQTNVNTNNRIISYDIHKLGQ